MSSSEEKPAKQDKVQSIKKIMMLGSYIDITKFCMKRCEMIKDFTTDQINELETECLGIIISVMRE